MHSRPAVLSAAALVLAGVWMLLLTPVSPARLPAADAPPASTAPRPTSPPDAHAAQRRTASPSVAFTAPLTAPPPSASTTPPAPPAATTPPGSTPPPRRVADILEAAGDLNDPAARERAVAEMRALQQERRAAAEARARELGWPIRRVLPNGRVQQVFDVDANGRPLYRTTLNANAARSSGAALLHAESPALTGSGVIVGVWDGGIVRAAHQEFGGRVTTKDVADIDDHATHVAGTVGAAGVDPDARGMAPAAMIHSYDWDEDYAEMTAAGATAAGQATKLYLSNHSYGGLAGWEWVGEVDYDWEWWGSGTTTSASDPYFGQYDAGARDVDAVVYSTPYLLVFRAAGNDGTDNPGNGDIVRLSTTTTTNTTYNSANHPKGDGVYRGGYENIAFDAIGKNVVTVGAVTDAVTGTTRDVTKATVVDFSSWGPTDDGRIKPDLVANGDDLHSPVALDLNGSPSNSAYDIYGGTSMATPSAAGSSALLVQLYGQLFPGAAMRASTLKALLLHTADDLWNAGPDYRTGWGLLNVKAAADLLRDHATSSLKSRVNERQLNTTTTTITHEFVWDGVSPIRATLCWTDPAGTATTSTDLRTSRLRNNLDLKITGPDGTTHLPWVMPFVGTWTQASMALPATMGVNNTDNVEQVFIAAPAVAGVYRAIVSFQGTLTNNVQDYGLIISGSAAEPSAPIITTQPASQSVTLGGSVTFSVGVSGTAPLTYQWRKDGQDLPNTNAASLTLTNVQSNDAGSYDVVITNSLGTATSNAVTLSIVTVSTISWNFTTNGAPTSALPAGVSGGIVTKGNDIGTTTISDGTSPSTGYTGASGGNNAGLGARVGALNKDSGGSGYFTFTLTPDAGKRVAVSGVSWGMRRSNTGPQAWALYSSVDNYANALATGTQTANTTWALFTPTINTVNGTPGTPVTFRLYGYNGSGSYSGGSANWRIDDLSVTLAVQSAPTTTTSPVSQSVTAGANATFTVVASGTSPLSYQWRRNTQPLNGATTASYTIVNVQPSDAASYDVVVSNAVGSATSAAATLTVQASSGFNAWLSSNFSEAEIANAQISGPNVVLTADGLTNLMKYALGLHPRVVATSGLPVATTTATDWSYTFTRPVERADLVYAVQASTNLTDWTTITVTLTKLGTADGVETWRADYPRSNAVQLFFRLRVEKQ